MCFDKVCGVGGKKEGGGWGKREGFGWHVRGMRVVRGRHSCVGHCPNERSTPSLERGRTALKPHPLAISAGYRPGFVNSAHRETPCGVGDGKITQEQSG